MRKASHAESNDASQELRALWRWLQITWRAGALGLGQPLVVDRAGHRACVNLDGCEESAIGEKTRDRINIGRG
jgi:hypothetical protein